MDQLLLSREIVLRGAKLHSGALNLGARLRDELRPRAGRRLRVIRLRGRKRGAHLCSIRSKGAGIKLRDPFAGSYSLTDGNVDASDATWLRES